MESHYALGVKVALGRMDLLQMPRHSLMSPSACCQQQ